MNADGRSFSVVLRIDTPKEEEYFRHGGILLYVLRQLREQREPSRTGRPIGPVAP